jgi:hypothetical protein
LAVDLLSANDRLIDEIKEAFDTATADGEQGVANFLADRQDAHSKWAWQLRSSLGIKSLKGNENSGNFGHAGRPGEVGGSGGGSGGGGDGIGKPYRNRISGPMHAKKANEAGGRMITANRYLQQATERNDTPRAEVYSQVYKAEEASGKAHSTSSQAYGASEAAHSSASHEAAANLHRDAADYHIMAAERFDKLAEHPGEHDTAVDRASNHRHWAEAHEKIADDHDDHVGYKSFIKVIQSGPEVKVLYTPPDPEVVAKGISEAVERVLSRKTGKLL